MTSPINYNARDHAVRHVAHSQVLLHKGFADAYDSVKGVIRTVLDDLCRRPAERGGQALRVYVAGHSLGGALATLCAWDLATRA
jgi:nuclear pore complex protein Nup85